jgi:hypothetical protein
MASLACVSPDVPSTPADPLDPSMCPNVGTNETTAPPAAVALPAMLGYVNRSDAAPPVAVAVPPVAGFTRSTVPPEAVAVPVAAV